MAQAFVTETTVAAPADRVWATLTDWERAPEWMAGIDTLTTAGPTVPGTEIVFEARGRRRPARIVEVDDGRSLVVRSTQGPVTADYRYEVVAEDDQRSRLRLVADCEVRGPLAVLAPLLRRSLRRTDGGQPAALGALVEAR